MKYKVLNERKGKSVLYRIYYKIAGNKLKQTCLEQELESLIRGMEYLGVKVDKITRNEVTTIEEEIEL